MTNITKGSNGKYVNSKWGLTFSTCIVARQGQGTSLYIYITHSKKTFTTLLWEEIELIPATKINSGEKK